jgi:hypothetical protein
VTNSNYIPTEEVIDFACSYNEEASSMCMRPHLEQGDDKKFIPKCSSKSSWKPDVLRIWLLTIEPIV